MEQSVSKHIRDEVSLVICGEAGQGIQTVERLLTRVLKLAGFHVSATKEYMSRVRGGSNSTEIRVSSRRVSAFVNRIDILIPLDKDALGHLAGRISDETIIIGDREKLGAVNRTIIDIPFSKIAAEIGSPLYANTIGIGVILGLLKVEAEVLSTFLSGFFEKKSKDIIEKNIIAGKRGHELGSALAGSLAGPGKIDISITRDARVKDEMLANGAELISMGAIAGGCDFVAAYPMTPSTGILTFLSQHAAEFGIIAEQAEDEISAINMAIGAWYAGARALVPTAGGGFSLMAEALSLAGMIESPLVISVGQRPAPATGLPTRTEQGDLESVLYAGHGEFPRAVLAPGTVEQGFHLMQKAFALADRCQVPVIVLSDQYLVDMYYNIPPLDVSRKPAERAVIATGKEYKRYAFTPDGISPRGIPGHGEGLVAVDSDEHDEEGHITENLDLRVKMTEKRLKKKETLQKEALPPELIGAKEYKTLIIGWGSTYGVIKEALEIVNDRDMAFLHFSQVYPLHESTAAYLKKAQRLVIAENNATGQFAKVLMLATGIEIKERILKYNGMPFTLEEMTEKIRSYAPHERAEVLKAR